MIFKHKDNDLLTIFGTIRKEIKEKEKLMNIMGDVIMGKEIKK